MNAAVFIDTNIRGSNRPLDFHPHTVCSRIQNRLHDLYFAVIHGTCLYDSITVRAIDLAPEDNRTNDSLRKRLETWPLIVSNDAPLQLMTERSSLCQERLPYDINRLISDDVDHRTAVGVLDRLSLINKLDVLPRVVVANTEL